MSKRDGSFPIQPPAPRRRAVLDTIVDPAPSIVKTTVDQQKRVQVVVTMTEDERACFKTAVADRRTSIQDVLYAAFRDFVKRDV